MRGQSIPAAKTYTRSAESDEGSCPFLGHYSWPRSVRVIGSRQLIAGARAMAQIEIHSLKPALFLLLFSPLPRRMKYTSQLVDTPAHKLSSVSSSPCSWQTATHWLPFGCAL